MEPCPGPASAPAADLPSVKKSGFSKSVEMAASQSVEIMLVIVASQVTASY